jgi:outer membrane lipoprotein-sorting protein
VNDHDKSVILDRRAAQAVSGAADLWPAIRNEVDRLLVHRTAEANRSRWWPRPVIGIAAAAALVLAVGVGAPLVTQSQPASAQVILDRAEAAANDASLAVTTYHLQMTRQVPGKQNTSISVELWYGGKDRQRSDQQIKDANGASLGSNVVVRNGADTWLTSTMEGQTQVVHTIGTTWTDPVEDPTKASSLADVLAQYSNGKMCMKAHQSGEATVANRAAYVIVLRPDPLRCAGQTDAASVVKNVVGSAAAAVKATSDAAARAGQRGASDGSVGQMTVWVDKQSFLPLRTEVRNGAGEVLDQSVVTKVEYNVALPDAVFSYTPPAGVTVHTFTGGTGADVKRTLYEGMNKQAPPAKGGKP